MVVADLIAAVAAAPRLARWIEPTARAAPRVAFHAFVLVATLPVLLLAAVDGQLTAAKQEADGSARLHEVVTALSGHIGDYVSNHQQAVQSLAALTAQRGSTRPPAAAGRSIHGSTRGFITIFVADRMGVVREIFPPRDSDAPPITDRQ